MQVGIATAIKTVTDRFEPLNDVYREFIGDVLLAEDLGFDFVSTSEHHFEADAWSPRNCPSLPTWRGARPGCACTPTSSCCRCTTRCGYRRTPRQ